MALPQQKIDAIVRAAMKTCRVPGAAIAIVAGDETYIKGFGVREKGKDATVTPDTVFALASVSKAFTTTALALLVEEKKIAWDDLVRKHLPQFHLSDPLADANVTVRDLVCHRTGLPRHDGLWYRTPWGRAELLSRMGRAKPSASFRSLYQYNNLCFMAAGEVARAASGAESFEAFVRERLFVPLGMTGASWSAFEAEAAPDHATPHRKEKQKISALDHWLDFTNVGPCGAMNASANDLAKWLRFQLAGGVCPDGTRLLSEATLRETHTPQMVQPRDDTSRAFYPDRTQSSYGLGWSIYDFGGHGIVAHGGAIDGFRSHVALVPRQGIGVAILVNATGYAQEIVRDALLTLLLDLPSRGWNADHKAANDKIEAEAKTKKAAEKQKKRLPSPLPLSDYVGVYTEPAFGEATVTLTEEGLYIIWASFGSGLRHTRFASFVTTSDADGFKERTVGFTLDSGGTVTGLTLFEQAFTRKPAENAKN